MRRVTFVEICIVLATLMMMFAGCAPRTTKIITASRDSSHVRTERIIDTVKMNADSALLAALLECDSLGRVRLARLDAENGRLIGLLLELQDNYLRVKAQAQATERMRETVVHDTMTVYKTVPEPIEVPVVEYRQRSWQRWLCWVGLFYIGRTLLRLLLNRGSLSFKNFLKLI